MKVKVSKSKVIDDELFVLGRDVMGPIVANYLSKLLQTCFYFSEAHNAKVLFCTRAGLRILHALNVFSAAQNIELPDDWELFWVSRMMIAKGVWRRSPAVAAKLFDKEFRNVPVDAANDCITGKFSMRPAKAMAFTATPSEIGNALQGRAGEVKEAVLHLEEQSALFEESLTKTLDGRRAALLIDTGWIGTSQRMLTEGFPEIEWWGAYFGLSGDEHQGESRAHWAKAIGLVFQADQVDPDKPETCIIESRHLIESLFEPAAPSIEAYVRDAEGKISAIGAEENLRDLEAPDPFFAGVLEHLKVAPSDNAALAAAAAKSWLRLQALILTPTEAEVRLFANVRRSADFGKPISVPLVLEPRTGGSSDQRLKDALWSAGQIALEYEPGMAKAIQRKRFVLPHSPTPKRDVTPRFADTRPKIAVITRTMDRPIFLRRALLSVQQQSFRDYVHVIISDGGDIEYVEKTIREAPVEHDKIILIDNVENRGMEAASNIGISASETELVVIHDDDDTWAENFLEETVAFLDSEFGKKFGGVLTRSYYVSESVLPEGLEVHNIHPYNADLQAPTFHAMMRGNSFAPISFVFRRDVYNEIGPFNEDYPVLGDWEFNLRFLERYNIGIIPKELAYYHHRDIGDTKSFGNSVIEGTNLHQVQLPIMYNEYLRRAANGPVETASASALNVTIRY